MSDAARKIWSPQATEESIPTPPESGVRLTERSSDIVRAPRVTLVIYEWESVEPGVLSWVFPNLQAALSAAAAMKNATKWAIVIGARDNVDVERERASGLILAEAV
jgi:hypothetical protein